MKNNIIIKALIAGLFSSITIGALTILTYKTEFGIFSTSFGSSMVLLDILKVHLRNQKHFGHLATSLAGLFVFMLFLCLYILICL